MHEPDPSFADRRERLTATVVRSMTGAVAVVALASTVLYMVFGTAGAPGLRSARLAAALALAAVAGLAFALASFGRARLAAIVFLGTVLVLLVSFPLLLQIGIWSGTLPPLAILIVFAGFVFGPRIAAATTGVGIAAVVTILIAQRSGWIVVSQGKTPPAALIGLILIVVFVLIGWLTIRYAALFGNAIDSLEQSGHDLEATVRRLRASEDRLRFAIAEVEFANRSKSRFLATMSHEIRTPLNGILGMAQLLLIPGVAEVKREEYARTILDSGEILLVLLSDILDLAKVEAGKLELAPAPLEPRRLIIETGALFEASARRKGLHFEASWSGPSDRRYLADAVRLRQMLANLVDNAIKFTAAGSIRLEGSELAADDERPARLLFAVSDSGIGIAAETQAALFQAFTQVDGPRSRDFGGTGLGLWIVRSMTDLMGGEVGVDSTPGVGSRFWFRIPAQVVAAGALG
jgi:signal transduction histidine kinase